MNLPWTHPRIHFHNNRSGRDYWTLGIQRYQDLGRTIISLRISIAGRQVTVIFSCGLGYPI